jgi:hypothetical protein
MRRFPPLAALVLVLVLAACGSGSSKPYTAGGTKACFVQQGFTGVTTNAVKVGFIAAFAANGGLQAKSKTGNVVTIAFTDGPGSVPGTLRPHMSDIMESQGNAVLVWTVSPTSDELSAAERCLAP